MTGIKRTACSICLIEGTAKGGFSLSPGPRSTLPGFADNLLNTWEIRRASEVEEVISPMGSLLRPIEEHGLQFNQFNPVKSVVPPKKRNNTKHKHTPRPHKLVPKPGTLQHTSPPILSVVLRV